jgi:hypothetical protein
MHEDTAIALDQTARRHESRTISLDPLLALAHELERQAAAMREQAAHMEGRATGLREAVALLLKGDAGHRAPAVPAQSLHAEGGA